MQSRLYFGIYDILDYSCLVLDKSPCQSEGAHYINLEVVGS